MIYSMQDLHKDTKHNFNIKLSRQKNGHWQRSYGFRFLFCNKLKEGRTDDETESSYIIILAMRYFDTYLYHRDAEQTNMRHTKCCNAGRRYAIAIKHYMFIHFLTESPGMRSSFFWFNLLQNPTVS